MAKKQENPYPLRIDKQLMNDLKELAGKDARSVNKEISFILQQYVDSHK